MRVTPQISEWTGAFGQEYTDRNLLTPEAHDALYAYDFGITRKQLNQIFLQGVPKDARILEVGCNIGNQLVLLQQMGYWNLFGIEIQTYALELARSRTKNIVLSQGSVFRIPESSAFDLVFTSRVLIHVSIEDLGAAMDEIYRCAGTYIWGLEYYSPRVTEVNYRNRNGLLWKTDYAKFYLDRFKDLELVREQRLPYLHNKNVDSMFLLRKKKETASGELGTVGQAWKLLPSSRLE
jgi:pseudaminic acid biosynthesis-associated methylase